MAKGYPMSLEAREKISMALRGRVFPHMIGNKHAVGCIRTLEQKDIVRQARLGQKASDETKIKIRLARARQVPSNLGKIFDIHWCQNMSRSRMGRRWPDEVNVKKGQVGELHHRWGGGVSFGEYGLEFNRQLKQKILQRDSYRCTNCGVPQEECISSLVIHHNAGNKGNNNEENLRTMCRSCHLRLHHRLEQGVS